MKESNSGAAQQRNPQDFVLHRELNEVHLLLDNISSNPNKVLPAVLGKAPPGLPEDWLKRICQIQWPTEGSNFHQAEQAELLIGVKDYLNTLTAPASGASIAFTLLVTQQDEERPAASADEVRGAGPSRGSLALGAFPDLWSKARRFRRVVWWTCLFLFVWLVFTCLVSWYVAFGNAALARRANADTAYSAALTRVEEVESAADKAKAISVVPALEPKAEAIPIAAPKVTALCERAMLEPPLVAGKLSTPQYESVAQLQSCRKLTKAAFDLAQAERQVVTWITPWEPENPTSKVAYAEALAAILGTAALPVLYGILGAGAAILRDLSRKMRLSLLTPRDFNLSLQQLALGAVMGACIGLFVAQPSSAGESVLGAVALSGSALSFIAGFGVDAVFSTIENIINRLFNIQKPGSASPASAVS